MRIQTIVHDYERKLDTLPESRMYDVELQRDLARGCVGDVGEVVSSWRSWRRGKEKP